ncbi:MAG: NERD domain-containing protein [Clostridia bacterium]|nr:NERD domain-containing protein [Clostridia bacterium]
MNDTLLTILIAFGIVDLLALFIYLIFKFSYNKHVEEVGHYGDRAEHLVQEYIHEHFPDAFLLNNLYFQTKHGLTQIDHILICRQGLYIIETKSHNGHITVRERNWTQEYKGKNVAFHNPVKQNRAHVRALKTVLASDEKFAHYRLGAVVVFTSKNVTFSENVRGVIRLNRLADFIKRNPMVKKNRGVPGSMRTETMRRLKDTILKGAIKSRRKHQRHKTDMLNKFAEEGR